jgi:hypothetical protein
MSRTRLQIARARRNRRFALIALIACLLAALAVPATAPAARDLVTGFEDGTFQSQDAATRQKMFDRVVDAQAGVVRLGVIWNLRTSGQPADPTNPADPAYLFVGLDDAVRDARARGLKVLLAVNGAPDYAEEPGRPSTFPNSFSWKPIPSAVADFMQAVAKRYSGNFDPDGAGPEPPLPAAQAMEVWNEANSSDWISPQYEGGTNVSVERYRNILNDSYKAIKQVNPGMQVVAGATEPYGDPPGGPFPAGLQRTQPVLFWQQLLCVRQTNAKTKSKKGKKGKKAAPKFARTNCPAKPMFDVLSHHPIDNTGGGPLQSGPRPGDVTTPDMGRIVQILRAAERLGTVSGGPHPVWATEFWWDSKPPNTSGANLITQARWIEQTFYLAWKAGASLAVNFHLIDSPERPTVHAGFQSGIYFQDGRPKPSTIAFRFPFVTSRVNRTTLEAWGKAPEAGKLLIQRKQGGWKTVKKLSVGKGSVFDTKLKLSGSQLLRAKVGGSTSVTWKQTAVGAKSSSDGLSGKTIAILGFAGLMLLLAAAAVLRRRQVVLRRRDARTRPRPSGDQLRSSTAI